MIPVELLNLTFEQEPGRKWDSNVKFVPLGSRKSARDRDHDDRLAIEFREGSLNPIGDQKLVADHGCREDREVVLIRISVAISDIQTGNPVASPNSLGL